MTLSENVIWNFFDSKQFELESCNFAKKCSLLIHISDEFEFIDYNILITPQSKFYNTIFFFLKVLSIESSKSYQSIVWEIKTF